MKDVKYYKRTIESKEIKWIF